MPPESESAQKQRSEPLLRFVPEHCPFRDRRQWEGDRVSTPDSFDRLRFSKKGQKESAAFRFGSAADLHSRLGRLHRIRSTAQSGKIGKVNIRMPVRGSR